MKTRFRPISLMILGSLAALALAFMLRDVVEQLIVRPLAYLLWWLGLAYRYIPQLLIWSVLVLFLIYLSLGRLVDQLGPPRKKREVEARRFNGNVLELARQIERRQGGIYFKWQISRMLGLIALDLQELRTHNRSRKLEPGGSNMPPQVRKTLEAGLNTSFADYPLRRRWSLAALLRGEKTQPAEVTPFDGDLGPVIDYFEAEMENYDGIRRA